MDTIIETKNLGCKSGHRYLLNNINWKVERGEHWLVFGLNGSGKTTLLSIVAGFFAKTEGTVKVFGENYTNENVLDIRKKIGWVSSSFFDKIYSTEQVLDIVLSGLGGTLGIYGDISDRDIVRAKYLCSELHVGDYLYRPFSSLSKGERQNVLIARALMPNPEILVLDEPSTGLDITAREHFLSIVTSLADNSDITIICVTHHPEEILPIFKKCMLLREGKVVAQGDRDDVLNNETLSRALAEKATIEYRENGYVDIYLDSEAK